MIQVICPFYKWLTKLAEKEKKDQEYLQARLKIQKKRLKTQSIYT